MNKVYLIFTFALCFYSAVAQITHFEASGYDNLPISGLGNWHVLAKDLNGDGFVDLYITREAQKDIMFYGNIDGTFTEQNISNETWNTSLGSLDIISTDLNQDGLDEIIITKTPYNGSSNDLIPSKDIILKNLGNGNYLDASNNLPTEVSIAGLCIFPDIDATNYTTGVATGLLNNDTIPDIIMTNGGISYLPHLELFNNSPILCKEKLKNDIYFSSGTDANMDGIDDYINAVSNTPLNKYRDLSTDAVIADFNGDGHDDVFVTNFYDYTILNIAQLDDSSGFSKVFVNTPSSLGDFSWRQGAGQGFPNEKYPATSVDAADFDQDGDIDLLIGTEKRGDTLFNIEFSSSMTSKLFLNDGNANFSDATSSVFPPFKPEYLSCYDIHFVDVNNDGWLDVYGAGITNFLFIQDDTINHAFTDMTHLLPTSQAHPANNITHTYHTYGAGFADFDNNGKTDALLACTYEQLHLLFQMGNGEFIDTTTTNLPPDGQNTEYAVIADFTGDNQPDIVKVNNDIRVNTHSFYIQTSQVNGHPYFTNRGYQIPLDTLFTKNYGIDYNDIDNDNDYDLLIAGESGIKFYENDNSGNFTENSTWLNGIGGLTHSTRIKFVDIDGDGDKDIFVPRAQNLAIGEPNKILLWNGNFYIDATSSLLPLNTNPSLDVDFSDINGDGWMDFIVANANNGGTLYLSSNGGLYSTSNPFLALSSSTSLKFIQLDADTLIDVVQVNKKNNEGAMIYKNTGSTPFYNTAITINNSNEESYDLNFHDFDGDGLNDLLIAGFSESNRIFVNKGNMNFVDTTIAFFPDSNLRIGSFSKAVVLNDVDQDGVVDIYLARDNQDLLLYGQGSITEVPYFNALEKKSVHVFPNPVKEYFTIDSKDLDGIVSLVIFSNDGKIIKTQKEFSNNIIQVGNLPESLYFLVIHHRNEDYSITKFLKVE